MDKGILRCPLCGGVFDVHSYYERTVIEASGQTGKITIMRVICQETGCGKTQAILPDFLMPYKRYAAVVIEDSFNSVDNGGRIDECEAAAEASTIMRWIRYLRYSLLIAINALQGILLEKGRKIGVKVFSGKNALERLAIAAAERQFLVVTGDSGTGKTTAARKFVSMLDPMRYLHFYISDSNLSPRNFYFQILNQLGIKPKFFTGDAKRQMMEELAKIIDARRIPVVTITKRTCAIWKC